MISDALLAKAEDFARAQTERTGIPTPTWLHVATEAAIKLARTHNVDERVVRLGTQLMDCMIGDAVAQGKRNEHIQMGVARAEALLRDDPDLTPDERTLVLSCIREHHGATPFSSIEAEICCNADCYRFLTPEGCIGGIKE